MERCTGVTASLSFGFRATQPLFGSAGGSIGALPFPTGEPGYSGCGNISTTIPCYYLETRLLTPISAGVSKQRGCRSS